MKYKGERNINAWCFGILFIYQALPVCHVTGVFWYVCLCLSVCVYVFSIVVGNACLL